MPLRRREVSTTCRTCRDGTPARIVAPDPRWFVMRKQWLGAKAKRNPLKRRKDIAQGKALLKAVAEACHNTTWVKILLPICPEIGHQPSVAGGPMSSIGRSTSSMRALLRRSRRAALRPLCGQWGREIGFPEADVPLLRDDGQVETTLRYEEELGLAVFHM